MTKRPDENTEKVYSKQEFARKILNGIPHLSDANIDSFPVEVFPEPFRILMIETQRALNYPPDYMGAAILAAVSVTIGLGAKLKVKNAWYEFCSLFIANVGNSGMAKSHPLDAGFNYHNKKDGDGIKEYREQKIQRENEKVANKKGSGETTAEPKLKKRILHDITTEVFSLRMEGNPNGLGLVGDELTMAISGFTNYSKTDQSDKLLSIASNKPTSIDRVSRDVPIWIPLPFLTIIGCIQPRVLTSIFSVKQLNNGLFARFLFAFPNGLKKEPLSRIQIDESVFEKYEGWFYRYEANNITEIDEVNGMVKSKTYFWSKDAENFFYGWQSRNTDKVNENSGTLLGEALNKFDNHFIRLALILQIMEDYNTDQVGLNAVEGGDSAEVDHPVPLQGGHPFRGKLTRPFRGKLTTPAHGDML